MLNTERAACGFGYLKQSAKLDLAVTDANTYFLNRAAESLASATAFGHYEVAGKTGFTAVYPYDRATYRGYVPADVNGVTEDNGTHYDQPANSLGNTALAGVRLKSLMTSVYHLGDLMTSRTEVAYAFARTTTADGVDIHRLNIVLGRPSGDAAQSAPTVRTYPCAGTTAVSANFTPNTESPNPAPDLAATTVGTPIYVSGPEGQTITVASASLVRLSDSAAVPTRIITYANDPVYVTQAVHMLTTNQAYVLPLAALSAGTTYRATIVGDNNGVAFTTAFLFTPST